MFGDRLVPGIHAYLAQHEATAETANADQTSGAQPSTFEAGHRLAFGPDRRGRFLRKAGEIANRGTNGLGSGQRNGPHADGSGEAKAETEPHHRDGAIQPRKSEPCIFVLFFQITYTCVERSSFDRTLEIEGRIRFSKTNINLSLTKRNENIF